MRTYEALRKILPEGLKGNSKDEIVFLFRENSPTQKPGALYQLTAVVRLGNYNELTWEEKLVTYRPKIAELIDRIKTETGASFGGFLNLPEVIEMFEGRGESATLQALSSVSIGNLPFVNVEFKNGEIIINEFSNYPRHQLTP